VKNQPRPRIAARALIEQSGALLLIKCFDHRGYWYYLPGGGQRANETLHECLHRELYEELGVRIDIDELLFVREIIADRHHDTELPAGFHQVEVVFRCRLVDGEEVCQGASPDPDQMGFAWVDRSRMNDILFFPRCRLVDGEEVCQGASPDPDQMGFAWVDRSRMNDILFFPRSIAATIFDMKNGGYLGEIR
jgi:8-oxo-dGTP diphosphatase